MDFSAHAKPIMIKIGDLPEMVAAPREFSTGSLGWNILNKTTVQINGVDVPVQIGLNLTLVGSKELPRESGEASTAAAGG
jgi:hypothetical protein